MNKSDNYMPITIAPRNKCHNCGNTNNLTIYYMKNKDINSVAPS